MRQKLIDSIRIRLAKEISTQNPLKYLKKLQSEDYIDDVISVVYLYTRTKKGRGNKAILMAEVISAIGHKVRNKYKITRNSALAARTGAFILYSFEELGMLKVVLSSAGNGHATYTVEVTNEDVLSSLWDKLPDNRTEKLPSTIPLPEWQTTKHQSGAVLIKTANRDVLDKVLPETHPIIYEVVNKKQQVGWQINEAIYNLHLWALRNKTEAFADIWEQANPEARQTKLREAKAIGDIAKRFIDITFYH